MDPRPQAIIYLEKHCMINSQIAIGKISKIRFGKYLLIQQKQMEKAKIQKCQILSDLPTCLHKISSDAAWLEVSLSLTFLLTYLKIWRHVWMLSLNEKSQSGYNLNHKAKWIIMNEWSIVKLKYELQVVNLIQLSGVQNSF